MRALRGSGGGGREGLVGAAAASSARGAALWSDGRGLPCNATNCDVIDEPDGILHVTCAVESRVLQRGTLARGPPRWRRSRKCTTSERSSPRICKVGECMAAVPMHVPARGSPPFSCIFVGSPMPRSAAASSFGFALKTASRAAASRCELHRRSGRAHADRNGWAACRKHLPRLQRRLHAARLAPSLHRARSAA